MPDPDDLCPQPFTTRPVPTEPLAPPLYLSAVYRCADPAQAASLLAGEQPGYVYSRDAHPNADLLAQRCAELHGADRAVVCGSGMGALAAASLALLVSGDAVVVSNQLYGRTLQLYAAELPRWGIATQVCDTCDLQNVARALSPRTRLVIVESISNPLLRVADLTALAELAHRAGALLLVDNTFASPAVCRPLDHGADLVVESLTKIMGGHSDVLLGVLCGSDAAWQRVPGVCSTWGLSASPFECWLAARGIATLGLRAARASTNALAVARHLQQSAHVAAVYYPGLPIHPDHATAAAQFIEGRFGSMVTFRLHGGLAAAEPFIAAAQRIPFCPSLGDVSTTLSHPVSTSHRALSPQELASLGIDGGTIRLSVGIESTAAVVAAVDAGLAALA